MYASRLPAHIDAVLTAKAAELIGKKIESIASFARLNNSRLDTSFRIHSDAFIRNKKPDYACIYYLNTNLDSGTAFYKHADYGDKWCKGNPNIFTKDDGKWERYFLAPEIANSMVIFDSDLYHGRYPWQSYGVDRKDSRIVVVNFIKVLE